MERRIMVSVRMMGWDRGTGCYRYHGNTGSAHEVGVGDVYR